MSVPHILEAIRKLQAAFNTRLKADTLDVYEEQLTRHKLTESEMDTALRMLLDSCARMPTIAQILSAARPARVNAPTQSEAPDAITMLEREHSAEVAWLIHYRNKGDERLEGQISERVRGIEEHINRRLVARGQRPRYVEGRDGVEFFS